MLTLYILWTKKLDLFSVAACGKHTNHYAVKG